MKITNHLKSPKKFNIEELLNFCAKELNIPEDVSLMLVQNEKLLKSISKEVEYEALLQNPIEKQFVLFSKDQTINQYIICHEMIHMAQYCRGDLKMSNDFREITWKGKLFDNSVPYEDREWEQEAFSKQNKLWKKFKQTIKSKK